MSAGKTGSTSNESISGTNDESEGADVSNLDEIGKTSRSNGAELTKGEIFDLLKNSRRRMVIQFLRRNEGNAELNTLAEHIAAEENDISVRQLSSDQRKRVYIGLYQCHLPKMDSLGVVSYDKNRGTIELQKSVSQLLPYMEPLDEEDGQEESGEAIRTWTVPSIASAVIAIVTVGTLGLGPLAAVPAAAWTLMSVFGIFLIVGLHHGV